MRVIRVLFGFALACLAAAAALVLFVYTPAELASLPSGMGADRVTQAGLFALVVSPHVAMFAALPALVGVIIGERRGISGWGYYALVGIAIAVLGFLTQHVTETPGQTTILHNYALTAFLTAGLAGGFVYWLFSGRYVLRRPGSPPREPGRTANAVSRATPHQA
jgi:hypothetical protein